MGGFEERNGSVVKIVISKTARLNLKEIVDYIKQDSAHYAQLERIRIVTAIDKLTKHPLAGKAVPELEDKTYREVIFRNYRIIYKVISEKLLHVIAIHHQSRLLTNNPAFNLDE